MGVRLTLLGFVVLCAACSEDVVAPGVCPDFCPAVRIGIVDSIFAVSIERDSSYRGYVDSYVAGNMQVSTGGTVESRAVVRFSAFEAEFPDGPIAVLDSFELQVSVDRRSGDVQGLELGVFRLPPDVDTTTSFDDVSPFFDDSVRIGTVTVPDSITAGRVSAILPGDAFPTLVEDSLIAAVGLALTTPSGFVDLGTLNADELNTILIRHVQVDTAGGFTEAQLDTTGVSMDNYVFPALPDQGDTELLVGGAPAARSILRSALPTDVVDSSNVLRATLLMVPSVQVIGAPSDTVFLQAQAVAADVGAKSPVVEIDVDTLSFGRANVLVGSADTVRIDITHIVRSWGLDASRPRSMMLLVGEEAATWAEFRLFSSAAAAGGPILHVTYAPPIDRGLP